MLRLVPDGLDLSRNSFSDCLSYNERISGKILFCSDLLIFTNGEWMEDEQYKYDVKFTDCKSSWMARINLKEISATFTSKDGRTTIVKKLENVVVGQKNPSAEFLLTKNEMEMLAKTEPRIDVKVEYDIGDTEAIHWRVFPHYNFYERNRKSTLVVAFEDGKRIYTNLELLSCYSAYFDRLFDTEHSMPKDEETGLRLLKLNGYASDSFNAILLTIHPSDNHFKCNDIYEVLCLAALLEFPTVLQYCEKTLGDDNYHHWARATEKLLWSIQFDMPTLQENVIWSIHSPENMKKVQDDPLFNQLPKEVVLELLKQIGCDEERRGRR